jgi:hypothetical protein
MPSLSGHQVKPPDDDNPFSEKTMRHHGCIVIEGVRVGVLAKQNGYWYVMENVDFGFSHPFRYKKDILPAIHKWWNH